MTTHIYCKFEPADTPEGKMQKWFCAACQTTRTSNKAPKNRVCGPDVAKPLPGIVTRAVNLVTSVATAAPSGFALCTTAEVDERNSICTGCEEYNAQKKACAKCGCNLPAKQAVRAFECPLNKWPAVPRMRSDSDPINVVLTTHGLHPLGGIERWLIAMARYLPLVSSGRVTVSNVVVRTGYDIGKKMVDELSQFTKVVVNDESDATNLQVKSAVNGADVVIVSGMGDPSWLLAGHQAKAVWLSHSCCQYSSQFSRAAQASGLITHWASVGHLAIGVFPDDLVPHVTAIENGSEIERCVPVRGREWQRSQWGIRDDQIAVGYIGRLSDEKRPVALAEAIAQLPPQYVGIVVGSGQHEDRTRAESQRLAGNRVKFVGRMNLLGDAMAGMDVGLLASPAEGFCLSRTEMMLAGLPMVSTLTGELPRLETEHGQLCQSIPIGATGEQIAQSIEAWLSHPNRIVATERARSLSWDRYTAPAMAGRWADYLRQIVGV